MGSLPRCGPTSLSVLLQGARLFQPERIRWIRAQGGIIVVKSVKQKASAVIFTMSVQSPDIQSASKLIFHRFGSTYLLSQVWAQGDYNGRGAMVANSERELAKRYKTPEKSVAVSAE
jgi:hypothetical protein